MIIRSKISEIIIYLLVISLPFFNVRAFVYGFSIVFVVQCFGLLFFCLLLIRGKARFSFDYFDALLALYLMWSAVSVAITAVESAEVVYVKSMFYFLTYIALKSLMFNLSVSEIKSVVIKAIIHGCVAYALFVGYLYVISDVKFTFSTFGYWGFTQKLYGESEFSVSGEDVVRSVDLMRNTMGEVFAFYFISLLTLCRTRFICLMSKMSAFLFTVGMFSRRAFLVLVLGLLFSRLSISKFAFVLVSLMLGLFLYLNESGFSDNRLMSFESNERVEMYSKALEYSDNKVFLGYGYGAKLDGEKYVHNFVLASLFMTGILGGLLSVLIVIELARKVYIEKFIRNNDYALLLLIPLFGAMVGSTVEGMFTITGWCVFAVVSALSRKEIEGTKNYIHAVLGEVK